MRDGRSREHAFRDSGKPTYTKSRARITHGDPGTEWIESYSYFGGAGQTLMVKAQAEPGLAPERDEHGELVLDENGDPVLVDTSPDLRWIGNGRTILDNKGNPVRQYEPYYSSTHEYEDEAELVERGVSPLIHYDPIGRVLRTDFPDGTFAKAEFTPWESTSWDANDTVADSDWYAAREGYVGSAPYWQKERRAAELAFEHRETPSKMIFDSLGRPFLGIEDLGDEVTFETKVVLDIRGLPSQIIDARGNVAEGRTYGILGQVLETTSVDAGDRQALTTILGEPLRAWDAKDQCARVTYDELRRPVDAYVKPAASSEILLSRVIYGESLATPQTTNHRGRAYRTYDGGGQATTPAYDFKGIPTTSELRLPLDPTTKNDWTSIANETTIADMATAAASSLETTVYTSSSTHDALGRVLTAISPDGSEVAYAYNERGALKTVDCKHRGSSTAAPVVANIEYDVRGRRASITYAANATTTTYGYDPLNFRLRSIETTRTSDSKKLQGLHYHFDPVGNITDIRDDAQQTVYFQNSIVEAANSYEYDALYRLIEATGREHATQGTAQRGSSQLLPDSSPIPMANDPDALRRYTQSFEYDAVGNITKVVHAPASGTGWTRRYQYRTDGNRLVATSTSGDSAGAVYTNTATYTHVYPHDVHGNFTSMPHIAAMDWDELDQLHHCKVGLQDVYFQYAGGQRIRKYVEHSGGTTEERIYLGPFELYRKRVSGTLKEEWESLHVSDDAGRIVLVETHTVDDGSAVGSPTGIWRFQLSNHLGSAATEVTETGAIISYEEYHPYGTSAYRLEESQIDVPAKRYRYTGMERDEETGLGYHTARYYAPWLGRWTAADPIGLGDGLNRYSYVHGNPTRGSDPSGASESEVQTQSCDAKCREETIASYKEERQRTRDQYMTAYSEWMRLDNSPGNAERVENVRDLYSQWEDYGQAISDMERQHAELLETERGASQILGSNKMIAAVAVIGAAAAVGYLVAAVAGGGFFATVAGGGADGAIIGGGFSAVDGNDTEQVLEDTKTGGAWGLALGGFGYGAFRAITWARGPAPKTTLAALEEGLPLIREIRPVRAVGAPPPANVAEISGIGDDTLITTANGTANAANGAMLRREYHLQDIAAEAIDSLRQTGQLPPYYVTKEVAEAAGWGPGKALVHYVPNGQIGGNVFNDAFGDLAAIAPPGPANRVWHEADIGLVNTMKRSKQASKSPLLVRRVALCNRRSL